MAKGGTERRRRAAVPDPRFDPPEGGDQPLAPPSAPVTTRAQVTPSDPVTRRFQKELRRIQRLQQQLDQQRQICEAHLAERRRELQPLQNDIDQQACEVARKLGEWLTQSDHRFTSLQTLTAQWLIGYIRHHHARPDDAEMAALHERHQPKHQQARQAAEAAETRERLLEEWKDVLDEDAAQMDLDSLLRHIAERLQAEPAAADEAAHAAEPPQSRRRSRDHTTQPSQPTPPLPTDPSQILRQIYRQLARQLHPDRARTAAEQESRHHLMSEANAAYQREDILALLQLHDRLPDSEATSAKAISTEWLPALTQLLHEQAVRLDRQRQQEQAEWWDRLDMPWGCPLTADYLDASLEALRDRLITEGLQFNADWHELQDRASAKRWLSRQRHVIKRSASSSFDPFD